MTGSVPRETPAFAGFPPEAMSFLGDLRVNNRREWFVEHRAVYERAVRAPACRATIRMGVSVNQDETRRRCRSVGRA